VTLLEDDEASPRSRSYPLADLELEPRPAVEPTCQLLNRASSDDDSSIRSHDCEGVTDRARADARKAAGARVVRRLLLPDRCHSRNVTSSYWVHDYTPKPHRSGLVRGVLMLVRGAEVLPLPLSEYRSGHHVPTGAKRAPR
jgi:hypothetical protein